MTELDISEVQNAVGEWAQENFGEEQPTHFPLFGIGEEIGELGTSVLKRAQGIDDHEKYQGRVGQDAEMDAIGDVFIYLMDFTYRSGIESDEIEDALQRSGRITADEIDDTANAADILPVAMFTVFSLYGVYCELIDAHITGTRDVAVGAATVIEYCELFCDVRGYDFDTAVTDALDEVLDREWNADIQV